MAIHLMFYVFIVNLLLPLAALNYIILSFFKSQFQHHHRKKHHPVGYGSSLSSVHGTTLTDYNKNNKTTNSKKSCWQLFGAGQCLTWHQEKFLKYSTLLVTLMPKVTLFVCVSTSDHVYVCVFALLRLSICVWMEWSVCCAVRNDEVKLSRMYV